MSLVNVKVMENNTFEWKININENIDASTGNLSIDGYNYEIICDRHYYRSTTKNLCQFRISSWVHSLYPIYYTINILDREGQVFVTSKGKVPRCGLQVERILMIIDTSYLITCNLIETGAITLRFSINHKLDAQEGPRTTEATASNGAGSTSLSNSVITKESSTNTDGNHTNLLEILSNDFSTFYENKTNTDCVLKVNDDQFHVHRAVLSARSSVFSAMFYHDTTENRSGEVNIPDVKATALSDVLYYIYSGKIRSLTADTAASVYTAADKYDLLELRTECLEYLKREITMDNFCEIALLSHSHGEMELEERVVWFIEEKLDEVLESNAWQQFLKERTLIASKLLTSALKVSKKKQFRDITSK